MKWLRAFCIVFPAIGIFIAIGSWLFRKSDVADQLLFMCFIGFFFNIVVLLPAVLIARAVFF